MQRFLGPRKRFIQKEEQKQKRPTRKIFHKNKILSDKNQFLKTKLNQIDLFIKIEISELSNCALGKYISFLFFSLTTKYSFFSMETTEE